jgi:hypothetical protein
MCEFKAWSSVYESSYAISTLLKVISRESVYSSVAPPAPFVCSIQPSSKRQTFRLFKAAPLSYPTARSLHTIHREKCFNNMSKAPFSYSLVTSTSPFHLHSPSCPYTLTCSWLLFGAGHHSMILLYLLSGIGWSFSTIWLAEYQPILPNQGCRRLLCARGADECSSVV